MVQIGRFNSLEIIEKAPFGLYLNGGEDRSILLPNRYVPDTWEIGEKLEVFVHHDSEDRLVASTIEPFAEVGSFAFLKVVAVGEIGTFLDWGLPKDLFLPFAEQTRELLVGHSVIVYLYLDKSQRISASMRLDRHVDSDVSDLDEGQSVDLLISGQTDLGYKAIINYRHLGVLFENEVFQKLHYGEELKGYIKKIRPDGKIDLSLSNTSRVGHQSAEDIAPQILALLKTQGGFAAINDKTAAEEIYKLFGVSKKKYKIALGGLYKQRLIRVEPDGIYLTADRQSST